MEKEHKAELMFASIGFAQPLSTFPIYPVYVHAQFSVPQLDPKYEHSSTSIHIYVCVYMECLITNAECQNIIQNLFGATPPRQCPLPVDEEIFILQHMLMTWLNIN